MKNVIVFVASIFFSLSIHAAPPDGNWQLTKAYEFNEPDGTPDLSEFTTQYIWSRDTIINNEQQYYVDPNNSTVNPFLVNDGVLWITASPTPNYLKSQTKNLPLISGVLTTRDKGHNQKYGYWEGRMKLPSAAGAWPAFWLLPTYAQWPAGIAILSEIDIMEAVADVTGGVYHASIHTNQTGQLISSGIPVPTGVDLINQFNTYGLEWNAEEVIWYFNDREVRRVKTPADMHTERHMLINLATGGWGGDVKLEDYPASFMIDYLRVYENKSATKVESPLPPSDSSYPVEFQRLVDHLYNVYKGQ